jgi:hypothetical protein
VTVRVRSSWAAHSGWVGRSRSPWAFRGQEEQAPSRFVCHASQMVRRPFVVLGASVALAGLALAVAMGPLLTTCVSSIPICAYQNSLLPCGSPVTACTGPSLLLRIAVAALSVSVGLALALIGSTGNRRSSAPVLL